SLPSGQYEEYDRFMTEMEANLTEMHHMVNTLKDAQDEISGIVSRLKETNEHRSLIASGTALLQQLKAWDEEMIQRKSQAYDDVENFPNKFTAEYLFLLNHTESSLPSVNTPSKERKAELDAQWRNLKARGNTLLRTSIPAYNQELWSAGIGAIQLK
ncbi:MAG: glycosyl hydrolase, partial [Altibacter sp.]|nr:glycosyl hydrolase [Altibacter sp.]